MSKEVVVSSTCNLDFYGISYHLIFLMGVLQGCKHIVEIDF